MGCYDTTQDHTLDSVIQTTRTVEVMLTHTVQATWCSFEARKKYYVPQLAIRFYYLLKHDSLNQVIQVITGTSSGENEHTSQDPFQCTIMQNPSNTNCKNRPRKTGKKTLNTANKLANQVYTIYDL